VKESAAVVEYDLNDAIARYLGRVPHAQTGARREVKCQDCGADIIVEAGAQTARCTYCGGKNIVEEALPPDVLQPEALLPFNFDGKNAEERFRKWLAGEGFWGRLWVRLCRPSALQARASVNDLHGVYVPFWTYDTHAQSNWTAQAGYYYYVSVPYRTAKGGMGVRQERRIRWVWTSGVRRDHFDDWLVCASRPFYSGQLQALMTQIEPFPTRALVPFDAKYLAGFRAERYSVDLKAGWDIALRGIHTELHTRCGRDVPGDTHRMLQVASNFWGQSFKHVLLPVYVMSYRFKDQPFNVLINGSTGEVRGKAPLSWVKITILSVSMAAIIALIIVLIAVYSK
jgi:DNA-directed RNA polymerase subunit RPC12/RpoP